MVNLTIFAICNFHNVLFALIRLKKVLLVFIVSVLCPEANFFVHYNWS